MSRERESDLDPIDAAILAPLAQAARRTATQDAGPGPTPAVWHRLQLRRAKTARRRTAPLWFAAAAMAAGAVAVYAVPRIQNQRPLTYEVAQSADAPAVPDVLPPSEAVAKLAAAPAGDGYIRGVGAHGTMVKFSDGTRIDVPNGSRVSVLSRDANGARLRVEDGEAHFEVVHRDRTAWSVEAGPFVVYVTGTSFDVRWSGSDETVEVRLRSGSVRVGGPLLPERVTLRPGQRLVAHLATGELHIGEGPVTPEANASVVAAPAGPTVENAVVEDAANAGQVEATAPAQPAEAVGSARAPGLTRFTMPHRVRAKQAIAKASRRFEPTGWATAVAAGEGKTILAEAETHGIERTLAEVDGAALTALADAARYGSRPELAARALLAERGRFPGTPAARAAAFYLGKLTDDRGDAAGALDWYRRYLAEAPRGPFAAEALGREMLTVERLSGRPAAHDLAAQYVRRFPNGTYLLQAHSILANP